MPAARPAAIHPAPDALGARRSTLAWGWIAMLVSLCAPSPGRDALAAPPARPSGPPALVELPLRVEPEAPDSIQLDAATTDDRRAKVAREAGDPALAIGWWRSAQRHDPQLARLVKIAEAWAEVPGGCPRARAALGEARAECGGPCRSLRMPAKRLALRCRGRVRARAVPRDAKIRVLEAGGASTRQPWAGPARVVVRWPDGTTRARAVCVRPGETSRPVVHREHPAAVDPRGSPAERAARHRNAGRAHLAAERWCSAAVDFAEAERLAPEPRTPLELAAALSRDPHRCAEAVALAEQTAAECGGCPWRAEADAIAGAARARCAGTLEVRLDLPDARLTVDGRPAGLSSRQLAGMRTLTIEAPGHHPVVVPAPIAPGRHRLVRPALMPRIASPVAPPAPLLTAPALPALAPEPEESPPEPLPTGAWVAAAVATAGLVTGVGFTLAEDGPDSPGAVAGWVTAGSGLIVAVTWWWLDAR